VQQRRLRVQDGEPGRQLAQRRAPSGQTRLEVDQG
jgi:hypothetical protein